MGAIGQTIPIVGPGFIPPYGGAFAVFKALCLLSDYGLEEELGVEVPPCDFNSTAEAAGFADYRFILFLSFR